MQRLVGDLEEAAREEYHSLEEAREFLRSALGLSGRLDPVEELHRCAKVLGSRLIVLAPDGRPLPSVLAGKA